MRNQWLVGLLVVAGLIALLLYPFQVTVAPYWVVEVKNEEGKPFPAVCVLRWSQHYSVERDAHEEAKLTDGNGRVEFAERDLRVSLLVRMTGAIGELASVGVHASFGSHSHVAVYKLGYGGMSYLDSQNTSWSGWSSNQRSAFVLRRCPDGFSEDNCILPIKYMIAPGKSEPIDPCKPEPVGK